LQLPAAEQRARLEALAALAGEHGLEPEEARAWFGDLLPEGG